MYDKDFDPEKEPSPERKWWSIFERSTEVNDESKEREKAERAKQLKAAAKQRGKILDEQVTDPEEPQKGEKLRKKWRFAIWKKSEKQIEDFKTKEPDTVDSYWLAQLIVAERIIRLNEFLLSTEPKTDERRSTKTELDFMGLLSEKLSDPTLQTLPEIDEVHKTIVSKIKENENNEIPIKNDEIPKIIEEDTLKNKPVTREASFANYGRAILLTLSVAIRPPKPPLTTSPVHTAAPQPISLASIKTTNIMNPEIRPNPPKQNLTEASPVLAALTLAVVSVESHERKQTEIKIPPKEHVTQANLEVKPVAPLNSHITSPSKKEPKEFTTETNTSQKIESHKIDTSLPPSMDNSASSQRKFEHMDITELLGLASNISTGHGQYLDNAYRSGKIDRDGLIKVLKTHARKGNYHYEFRKLSREFLQSQTQHHPIAPPPIIPETKPVSTKSEQANSHEPKTEHELTEEATGYETEELEPSLPARYGQHVLTVILVIAIVTAIWISLK